MPRLPRNRILRFLANLPIVFAALYLGVVSPLVLGLALVVFHKLTAKNRSSLRSTFKNVLGGLLLAAFGASLIYASLFTIGFAISLFSLPAAAAVSLPGLFSIFAVTTTAQTLLIPVTILAALSLP